MDQVVRRKYLYKGEILLLKVIPVLLAICYFTNTVLSILHNNYIIFSIIGGMSILPMIYLYYSSYVYGFCEYHRMFLHYVVINDVITWYDYLYKIPCTDRTLLSIHIAIACICLFIVLYLKLKVCKRH